MYGSGRRSGTVPAVMQRARLLILALLTTLAVGAAPATAATSWKRCAGLKFWSCTALTVPLDHANPAGPKLRLTVGRLRIGKQPTPSAELVLTGGPGAAGLAPQLLDSRRGRDRDLLWVDLRGTGKSGALDCKLRSRATLDADVRSCWEKLGAARSHYTTATVIQDLEAVRQAAGYGKLDMQAYSYGTKVALDYAAAYPASTGRLTLDSVVPRRGVDPWMTSTLRAVPRVVRELCADGRCDEISDDAVADLAAVIADVRSGVTTKGFDNRGRARKVTINESALVTIFLAADVDSSLHPRIPSALASARAKDYGPLARLLRDAAPTGDVFPDVPVTEVSAATWLATVCEELPLPWNPSASLPERHALVRQLAAARPAESWGPFSPAVIDQLEITSCAGWPTSGVRAQPEPAPIPRVPTLVLSGSSDVRTPLEDAAALVAELPGAVLATATGAGHSGASIADLICKKWLDDWETRGGNRSCDTLRDTALAPMPPARLADLPAAPG
jgi:pimeloyl-ACP methyl ester carboxylesterase